MSSSELNRENFFTPPNRVEIPDETKLVFLAGPVQGAPNYQDRFARRLFSEHPDIAVASPRRSASDQERFDADQQVEWEVASRERAYEHGVTGIWFAAQDHSDPSYPAGRAYAQTTRIEIGETLGRHSLAPDLSFVVGFDPEYNGGSEGYIRRVMGLRGLQISGTEDEFLENVLARLNAN